MVRSPVDSRAAHALAEVEMARLVPVADWAVEVFGKHCPHRNTLLNWIRDGKIVPPPKKIGHRYFCAPDASYEDPVASQLERMIGGR
ncbi:Excisionase-like protein [Caballeronia temeraria]|uniref:Excisionase-like protein n=1 Tax=Caballeronia temeraria TaxID=1777137 RepID=A0A158AXN2_9BURK|nr:Excisionase-like protein [Caballeronia temeraria]